MVKIDKTVARDWLADVPQEKRFWCADGRFLANLSQLAAALKDMSDGTFRQHTSETKSDFSNWVRDVIGDEKLTKDLQKSKTQAQAAKAVAERVAWLKGKAEAG